MDWTARFFEGNYQQEYFEYAANAERTAREVEFIVAQLGLNGSQHVLDLACGGGRHAIGVAPHVGRVTGLDLTPDFIAAAQRAAADARVANVEFNVADMRELAADAQFDAAYNYFTAWGYYDHAANIDVLARVLCALKPGGRFLIEILSRDRLMTIFKPRDYVQFPDGRIRLEHRQFDFQLGRLHNLRTFIDADGHRTEIAFDHYIPSSDALVRHLQDAGFSDVRLMEAPTGAPLTLQSLRMAAVAQRPA
jgi:ubiquinone/menaquinone biosynthesis C-methylase UbiE